MCIVTFVKQDDGITITSSREEIPQRAGTPVCEECSKSRGRLAYPRDPTHGGTWFSVREDGTVLVLLNGSRKRDQSGGNVKSRGVVLLEAMHASDPLMYLRAAPLLHIMPFRIILYQESLIEFTWDGTRKNWQLPVEAKARLWSSTTLYSKAANRSLQEQFLSYTAQGSSKDSLFEFHRLLAKRSFKQDSFKAHRLPTLSITQVLLTDKVSLHHHNLFDKSRQIAQLTPTLCN